MSHLLVLLGTLSTFNLCFAQDTQAPTPENCAKWSIKGMHPGMTLKEMIDAHKNLKHGRNWFRGSDGKKGWYFWAEDRMKGLYNYVLPERDAAEARIISVMALLDVSESSFSSTIDALVARWGEPSAREVPVAKARYFNAFGAPRGEFDWLATTWQDPGCDIMATLLDKTKVSPVGGRSFKEVTLSIDSITGLVAKKEEERLKAKEVVRP